MAQTNSNDFNAAAYLLMRNYAKAKSIELIPGIEINLENWEDSSKYTHIVVLFNPQFGVYALQEAIRSIFSKNKKYFVKIDQLAELLSLTKSIVCIHGIKQDKRSLAQNPEIAPEVLSISSFMPVAFEDNQSYHKIKLKEEIKAWLTEKQASFLDSAASFPQLIGKNSMRFYRLQ